MNLGTIKAKTVEILGDVPGIFVDPADLARGVNWAVLVVAKARELTVDTVSNPFTSGIGTENTLDMAKYLGLISIGGTMLAKGDLDFINKRNPGWRSSTKPARYWFWINGSTIGIDGALSGSAKFVVLERPTEMVLDADLPDERLREVDHLAFAYLAAAYLVSLASSAQDEAKAKELYERGMMMAGATAPVAGA